MNIAENHQPGAVVLAPSGAVMGPDADLLGKRLLELTDSTEDRIVVDLGKVTQLDSRALEMLVGITEKLIRRGGALSLTAASDTIRQVLDITEIASLFEQYDDMAGALGGQA